jgi:hypothetical protein
LDFGPSAGIIATYFKSRSSNLPVTGVLRLANGDVVAFRNHANSADLALSVNASDQLTFNGSGLISGTSTTTLQNKTFADGSDVTKTLVFSLSGSTTGKAVTLVFAATANRSLTFPDLTDTVVTRTSTDTLTNKTLTAPVISTITNTGTLTLPTSTDTLVGRATTDTLTNKTLTSPTVNTPAINGQKIALTSKTANYTLTTSDDTALGDSSGGAFTFTLPTAVGASGKVYVVKKTDTSFTAITINTTSSQTIDGATSTTLNTQYETVRVISDGANWNLLSRDYPKAWQSFTMTVTGTTTNPTKAASKSEVAQWRRVGDSMELYYSYSQTATTGAANGSGTYLYAIPNSSVLTIDSTKIVIASATLVGSGGGYFAGYDGTNVAIGTVSPWDTTHIALHTGTNVVSSTLFNYTVSAVLRYAFRITVPITGWN